MHSAGRAKMADIELFPAAFVKKTNLARIGGGGKGGESWHPKSYSTLFHPFISLSSTVPISMQRYIQLAWQVFTICEFNLSFTDGLNTKFHAAEFLKSW
jgi:hypothetical protein